MGELVWTRSGRVYDATSVPGRWTAHDRRKKVRYRFARGGDRKPGQHEYRINRTKPRAKTRFNQMSYRGEMTCAG